MKKIIVCLLFIHYSLIVPAQNQASVSLNYHGYNLLHNGLEVAYAAPLLSWQKTNKKDRMRWYQIYYSPGIGAYSYRGNHLGLTVGTDAGGKITWDKGFEFEVFGGLHYLRTWNANPTYEQDGAQNFSRVRGAGNNYRQWRAGIGFGKNFLPKGLPFSVNVKLGVSQANFPSPPLTPNVWIGVHYFFRHNK